MIGRQSMNNLPDGKPGTKSAGQKLSDKFELKSGTTLTCRKRGAFRLHDRWYFVTDVKPL